MEKENQIVKVGVGVLLFKDGKVLLGKRKNKNGFGQYAWPGGHLEFMESIEGCAKREVMEETGMEIENVKFLRVFNMKTLEGFHYMDIGVMADWKSGIPELKEPDKCEGWEWYDLKNLPSPLFIPIPSLIESFKTGKTFFDNID